jgi:hypothetical protein
MPKMRGPHHRRVDELDASRFEGFANSSPDETRLGDGEHKHFPVGGWNEHSGHWKHPVWNDFWAILQMACSHRSVQLAIALVLANPAHIERSLLGLFVQIVMVNPCLQIGYVGGGLVAHNFRQPGKRSNVPDGHRLAEASENDKRAA